ILSGSSVSPWRSGVEEGRSPLGRFRTPEPCFPRTYATWDAKKDENRFGSMKFRLGLKKPLLRPASAAEFSSSFWMGLREWLGRVHLLYYGTTGFSLGNPLDRKSTRLNSSHLGISYAV